MTFCIDFVDFVALRLAAGLSNRLLYIALYSQVKLHRQEILAAIHYRTRNGQMEGKSTVQLSV